MNRSLTLVGLSAPGLIFLMLFFFLPLGVLAVQAFSSGGEAFVRVFDDSTFWAGLRGSLLLGTFAPLFSVTVGLMVALFLARLGQKARTSLMFVISLPLTFSGLIVAYGFILVFGRSGFVTLMVAKIGVDPAVFGSFIYSPVGLGFAYSYYLIPRVVIVLLPVLVNFDMSQLMAARSLGGKTLRVYFDILLPQILPSILSAYCLVAAVAIGAYGTALALVGTQVNILPLLLYSKISETGSDFPAAAAMSFVLMALTTCVITLAEIFSGLRNRVRP